MFAALLYCTLPADDTSIGCDGYMIMVRTGAYATQDHRTDRTAPVALVPPFPQLIAIYDQRASSQIVRGFG